MATSRQHACVRSELLCCDTLRRSCAGDDGSITWKRDVLVLYASRGSARRGECANGACVDQAPSGVRPGLGRSEGGDDCSADRSIGSWAYACCFTKAVPAMCLYTCGEVCQVCEVCSAMTLVIKASHKAAQNDLAPWTMSRGYVEQLIPTANESRNTMMPN